MKIFITGTDTNCGKTYVTTQLLAHLNKTHKCAQAVKPIASGGILMENEVINEDVVQLQRYNADASLKINQWSFLPPISPHLAAQEAGRQISAQAIHEFCSQDQFNQFEYLLIEGAGGLMVPLNEQETWLDFLKLSQIPVILVVGIRLGCINHALLSDYVLQANNINCLGWIANCLDKQMLRSNENINTLRSKMGMSFLFSVSTHSASA